MMTDSQASEPRSWKQRGLSSVTELHTAYRSGDVKIESVIESHLEVAQKNAHAAYLTVCADSARQAARELQSLISAHPERSFQAKPLLGVPIGIKDNIQVEGERTTCASRILEHYVSPFSATVVDRLRDAGAVIIGKQNLDEFAMGGTGLLSAFRPVSNPVAPGRIIGGSSSGSAASVAEGSAWISLGSDTGGSVRLPAAYAGLASLKPTYGTVSRYGLIAYASSLDQIGPIAHSVEDVERVYRVMSGADPRDATSVNPRDQSADAHGTLRRVGVVSQPGIEACEPAVKEAYLSFVESLRRLGYEVIEVDLPGADAVVAAYYVIALGEASSNLARFDGVRFGDRPDDVFFEGKIESFHRRVRSLFGDEVKRRLLMGSHVLSAGYRDQLYLQACRMRRRLSLDFQNIFKQVAFILTPVATRQPQMASGMASMNAAEIYRNDAFTVTANLAGIPAVVIPAGKDREGLPFGVQLLGGAYDDFRLLKMARQLERQGQGGS